MTNDQIQTLAGILTICTAVTAMAISIVTSFLIERRNQKRWKDSDDRQMQIATANARPLLSISSVGYSNRRGLRLTNDGVGTAVITKVAIKKDDKSDNTVVDVIDIGEKVVWDTFRRFSPPLLPLAAGDERKLVELTRACLTNETIQRKSITEERARQILCSLKAELKLVEIMIEYEDVFGNLQLPCTWNASEEEYEAVG